MSNREKWTYRLVAFLCLFVSLQASGVIPAIIPAMVPTANKQGNSSKFQLGTGSTTTANCAQFDASANIVDSGSPCGSAASGGGALVYSGIAPTLTGTLFFPPGGGAVASATEASVEGVAPSTATVSSFAVELSSALGMGNSLAFTWRKNGASQSSTCTISGAVAVSCSDTIHSFTVAQGDLLDIQAVASGTIVVTPVVIITTLYGTTGNNGTVNSGTQGRLAYYAANGTTVSESGASTAHGVWLAEGTSAPVSTSAGTSGQCLTSNGASADPTYQTCGTGSTITYGAIGSLPAAGTSGRMYVPSDSYYDALFDNGSVWTYRCLDGITCTPPSSGSFTSVNSPTISTQTNGAITVTATVAAGNNIRSYVLTAPATPWTKTFRLKPELGSVDFTSCGVVLRESGTGKLITFGHVYSSVGGGAAAAAWLLPVQKYTNATTFSANYQGQLQPFFNAPYLTLRVADNGTNLTWSVSNDGVNYLAFTSQARNNFFTTAPDQVGVYANANNASYDATCVLVSVD